MTRVSRWLAPAVLATGLGLGAMVPAPAQAQDDAVVRVLVDVDDVVLRGGTPYYRHARDGRYERLVVQHDRYGRPVYYRVVPRNVYYGGYGYNGYRDYAPAYGIGLHEYLPPARRVKCSSAGNCTVQYYDPRYDRRGYRSRHDNGDRYDGDRGDRRRDGDRGDGRRDGDGRRGGDRGGGDRGGRDD